MFNFISKHASRKTQSRQRRARLEIESLEDRCVPTIITVIGNLDGAGIFNPVTHTDTTLRGAINNSSNGDTIEFAPGLSPIVLTSGSELPQITHNLSILNLNASKVTIDGNATSRIFEIDGYNVPGGVAVTITNLKLTNGNAGAGFAYGGAIYSGYSTLKVNSCLITGNKAPTGACGGIWQRNGNLTIQNSTIANNIAGGEGGGIGIDDGATVTIQNSTISGNTADNNSIVTNPSRGGGGIWCTDSTLTVQNSTISGNTVKVVPGAAAGKVGGGGIDFYHGTLTIESTTITKNTTAARGGGVAVGTYGNPSPTTLTLRNTIISGDSDGTGANDLYRHDYTVFGGGQIIPIINASFSLIQNPGPGLQGFINGTSVGNIFHTDPMLGSLADNGGPTQTCALLPGSPAIDHGNSALVLFPFDQRGSPFLRVVNGQIDIGAFEVQEIIVKRVGRRWIR